MVVLLVSNVFSDGFAIRLWPPSYMFCPIKQIISQKKTYLARVIPMPWQEEGIFVTNLTPEICGPLTQGINSDIFDILTWKRRGILCLQQFIKDSSWTKNPKLNVGSTQLSSFKISVPGIVWRKIFFLGAFLTQLCLLCLSWLPSSSILVHHCIFTCQFDDSIVSAITVTSLNYFFCIEK